MQWKMIPVKIFCVVGKKMILLLIAKILLDIKMI